MRLPLSLFVFCLFCPFFVDFVRAEGRGFLLVQKQIESEFTGAFHVGRHLNSAVFYVGQTINVTLNLYNVGQDSARDVQITDHWPAEAFEVNWGSLEGKFDEIPASGHVSLNYSLEAKQEGSFSGLSADVEYLPTADGISQFAVSSSAPIQIISYDLFNRHTNRHYIEWLFFGVGFASAVGIPFGIWFNIQQSYQQAKRK